MIDDSKETFESYEETHKISYPETTYMKPLIKLVKVNSVIKNVKPTPTNNSTKRLLLTHFIRILLFHSLKKSSNKGAHISKL